MTDESLRKRRVRFYRSIILEIRNVEAESEAEAEEPRDSSQ
jgi:hypothetical protein